ncbi:CTL [Dione juno nucleopolyhedrovirus]|uniref:CTL n=1 Tax=Dione juno nucleopolyhedrovirus TaxID=2594175 RepID=A0AAE6H3D7_9ABAC|nr:CTL [Dione juno nucleopolyhedrovirus]QDL57065.1 CTL [Dione juno nucleopolyhedrovirus]
MKFTTILVVVVATAIALGGHYALACTETGRNCQYSNECCSGACSAVFGFCLHR